jgi:2-polyprenyl-3-methyl-5-hydroxy-6-metoxy-1,4-benzoquinol methylase
MKILVAIANHGTKNMGFVSTVLQEYRSMQFETDIVVLSNIPKDLGPDIEVIVGCPAKDPWSLPFGHKRLFAERAEAYDLFIYSEDDTLIRETNIRAFMNVTSILPDDEVAGFIRFETDSSGEKYYSTMNSHFHWVPDSVRTIRSYTFARFTNPHSACYVLTQKQLKKAITSGGFLVQPHEEKYDLLVTAATDPYTQCGLTKVICVSHIEDFCLHHLPNQYLGRMGVSTKELTCQLDAIMAMASNGSQPEELLNGETDLKQGRWSKNYYENCRHDIIELIPESVKRVLSVGCGWGETEAELIEKGLAVAAVPLDPVIGAVARAKGVALAPASFNKAFETLAGQSFDCIVFSDVLQHLVDPVSILSRFSELLSSNGVVVLSVPNFNHVKVWRDLLSGEISWEQKRTFGNSRLHFTTKRMVNKWLDQSGMKPVKIVFGVEERYRKIIRLSLGLFRNLLASHVIMVAKRKADSNVEGDS